MQINVNQNFRKYVNDILSTSIKCAIDLPTRVTDHSRTLLDYVYVNDPKHLYTSGVLSCDLSDCSEKSHNRRYFGKRFYDATSKHQHQLWRRKTHTTIRCFGSRKNINSCQVISISSQ